VHKRSCVADSPDSGLRYPQTVGVASHRRHGNVGDVCLVHLPRTNWLPAVLAPVALPALVKGAIVLGMTRCLTLWPNDRCVRSTAVSGLLQGGATRASAGGRVGTCPSIACAGGRPHRGWWRSTATPRPVRSGGAGQFIRSDELPRRSPGLSSPGGLLPVGLSVADDRADGRRPRPRRQ
jgi:hypothetical protein